MGNERIPANGEARRRRFKGFYLRNVDPLLRYASSRAPAGEAEDLVAETFVRAFRAMPDHLFDHDDQARAWLFHVLRNLTISAARRRRTALDKAPRLVGRSATVEDEVTLRSDLDDALARLPDRQRAVLELRFVADLDVGSVGNVMGLSDEGVRALTHRSLRTLRAHLAVANVPRTPSPEPS